MAFARAVAAGFDVDHIPSLMSFAESFGASRLKDACVRFRELWKRKHESGQWLEIEAEAMSNQSDFSALNASGIILSSMVNKQKEFSENGKAGIDANADEKPTINQQPAGNQEYLQGQFPHSMFPPWPIHSPPGALPVFQGYPMQGMAYYPANSGYFHPPYPPMEDPRQNAGQRMRQRRHSMDSGDSNTELQTWEMDASKVKSQDDAELDRESSRKKASRSGKKQSGKVVIRNINYITANRQNSSGSESQSASNSETDEEDGDTEVSTPKMKHKSSSRSSKIKESHIKSGDASNSFNMEGTGKMKEEDGGQWHAFQNYLLRGADEEDRAVDKGMFAMEKGVRARRRQSTVGDDPLISNGRDAGEYHQENIADIDKFSGKIARMPKTSNDELLISGRVGQSGDGRRFTDGQINLQSTEIDGRRGGYRRTTTDDFIIHRQSALANSPSDSLAVNRFERVTNNWDRSSSNNMDDDSYIVPLRSVLPDEVVTDGRNAIDMDSEFPSSYQKSENTSNRAFGYEPDELTLLPERGAEKGLIGYDPALDYEMQAEGASQNKKNKQSETDVKQGSKKIDKDRKSKLMDTSDKKKIVGPIRKGKPSKLSPLDEARVRAEKLRTFKADMQKLKKQKEEEEAKRLEALKIERQKRIAARGSSTTTQSTLSSQQTRKQLPTKLSPSAKRSSKFSDSEPGSSSPLQRVPIRTGSAGSIDSHKASKPTKLNIGSHSGGNRLTRSVSSLPEPKKENAVVTPDTKVSMARIRRLSEPKMSSSQHVSSVKARSAEPVSKPKASDGSETKKISAIMNHDKSKAASLPELKIRKSKEPAVAHSKPAGKELVQKVNGTKSDSTSEGAELKRNKDKISYHSDADDNLVIEKTVVMLESERPSIPVVNTREENMGFQKQNSDDYRTGEKNEAVSDYVAIRAPVSLLTVVEVDKAHIEDQLQEQPAAYEIGLVTAAYSDDAEKETPKFPSVSVSEKPYQAPYARVSSLEDPCTRNSEYGRAPTSIVAGTEMVKARVSDGNNMKLEKIPEALDKPQTKESSKGFRRLLKFGKKNHSSSTGDRNIDSDSISFINSETDDAAIEVHTLKNLISQDETPTAASTPQKSSRSFSLLSPFRSKNSEKKVTT
ncbi:COP1-interacting protein-like protein [Citrus sinensis]|nr:COP1-interacting protein-like protein [Citrus sinensis]